MADLPESLDDGELWLPSDIFLGDVPSKLNTSCTDDLAQHFAAFSLFQSNAKSAPLPHFQRFRPPVQYCSVDPALATEFYRVDGGVSAGRGMGYRNRPAPLYSNSKPVYEYNFVKPTQRQVESFLEARARVLQRQQNRLHSRLMPIQGSGVGMGGFVRESGGTGVFLPRVFNNTNTDFRRKQVAGMRNRREIQGAHRRQSMSMSMQREEHYGKVSPTPELALPQDWTY